MEECSVYGGEFYSRQPDIVAPDLLGALIVRRLPHATLACRIVEVEAYFGACDPASRARRGPRGRIARALAGPVGVLLVYGVHAKWMVNIVAHEPGMSGAVLLRSCKPVRGVEAMARARGLREVPGDWRLLSAGPGRLSQALMLDRRLDGKPVYRRDSPVYVCTDGYRPRGVVRSWRVGVSEDLEIPLRFVDASVAGELGVEGALRPPRGPRSL